MFSNSHSFTFIAFFLLLLTLIFRLPVKAEINEDFLDIKFVELEEVDALTSLEELSEPPYPYYFSGFSDESDYCTKLLKWTEQVVNGYKELEDECFTPSFYIDKKCLLGGFDFGTYYKPTNVLRLYLRFDNYSEANKALTTITNNFSKCEGKDNVFINGSTGIDKWTEARVLRELKTQREIKSTGKRNVVTFQLIHKQYNDDYPAKGEIGYYVFFETRLD